MINFVISFSNFIQAVNMFVKLIMRVYCLEIVSLNILEYEYVLHLMKTVFKHHSHKLLDFKNCH